LVIGFDEAFLLWAIKVTDHIAGDQFGDVVVEVRVINNDIGQLR
jgi:hypothetical protein